MNKSYAVMPDLYFKGAKETGIYYVAGDTGAYPLDVYLCENGRPYSLPRNATALLNVAYSQDTAYTRRMKIISRKNGELSYTFTAGDLWAAGTVTASVTVISDGGRLTWPAFRFTVTRAVISAKIPNPHGPWTLQIESAMAELSARLAQTQRELERLKQQQPDDGGGDSGEEYENEDFPEVTSVKQGLDVTLTAIKGLAWK